MTSLHSVAPQGAGGLKSEHYPSLELCKKLTEAGFPQTEMYIGEYKHTQLNKEFEITIRDNCYEGDYETFRNVGFCPSVMELLDELPHSIDKAKNYSITIEKYYSRYKVYYRNYNGWTKFIVGGLPNALAEMWLWLKENNYLTK